MKKKYILLVILFSLSFISEAQSKKRKSRQKATYAIGISGGYFLHGSIFDKSENNFSGSKTFQIELLKFNNSKASGFSFGFLSKKSQDQSGRF